MQGDFPSALSARAAATLSWIDQFAPYGVITTDREFRIQTWNHWLEVHSGMTSDEVAGRPLFELFPQLVERGLSSRFERALQGEVSVVSTALHGYLLPMDPPLRDSGFAQMQQTALIAPLTHDQEKIGTIAVIEDVTQREQQALVLRRQRDRETILAWALAHLLEAQEPRRITRELFCKLAEHFDWDAYLLFLRDSDHDALRLHAAGGISPEVDEALARLDENAMPGRFMVTLDEPRALEAAQGLAPEERAFSEIFGFRACALVPLVAGAERLGVLTFGTRTRAALRPDELSLLSTIGRYLTVALGRESTTRKLQAAQARLRDHAQELERQVNERTARLRETVAELETFSYTVAHDLRAPLRALSGYCQVLIEDFGASLPEHARELIDRLYQAGERMNVLTRDLLNFAKVSQQDIHLAPVNLNKAMAEVMALMAPRSEVVRVQKPLFDVLAHPTLLQQCLANLLDNALKFVRDGAQPEICIWTELIRTPQSSTGDWPPSPFSPAQHSAPALEGLGMEHEPLPRPRVRIVVQDNGIGVAPEARSKIFGIFERGTSASAYRGSGIGLAIVARAMQRMGGACGVESELGGGSRFWLELPAAGNG